MNQDDEKFERIVKRHSPTRHKDPGKDEKFERMVKRHSPTRYNDPGKDTWECPCGQRVSGLQFIWAKANLECAGGCGRHLSDYHINYNL